MLCTVLADCAPFCIYFMLLKSICDLILNIRDLNSHYYNVVNAFLYLSSLGVKHFTQHYNVYFHMSVVCIDLFTVLNRLFL